MSRAARPSRRRLRETNAQTTDARIPQPPGALRDPVTQGKAQDAEAPALWRCHRRSDRPGYVHPAIGTPHHTSGTEGAGVPLTTAELSADRVGASVHTTVATDTSYQATQALLDLVAGRAVMILSSPFGAQALVADTHIAQ